MNDLPYRRDMREATRLTRAGWLSEATALLQRLLRGEPELRTASDATGKTGDGPARHPSKIIDVVPETIEVTDPLPSSRPGAAKPPPAHAREPVPDGGQFVAAIHSAAAGSRAYKLYIPSGYHGQALPLIVMLHGCSQSPDDFAIGTRMNSLAEERTCLVAYPAQRAAANVSKCWNWFKPEDQRRGQGEPSLIAGITRQVMRDYSVDPRCVYVAGLSAGAAAAAIMGMAYPDLYAAIGVHSGLACGAARDLASALAAMRQGDAGAETGDGRYRRVVPTIVFHGDQDGTVHPRNGDRVIAQSTAAIATDLHRKVVHGQVPGGHAYSRTLHIDASGRAIGEQWVIHGAGHAWSGGSPAGSYTDPRGPDATREMLRFFLENPRPIC